MALKALLCSGNDELPQHWSVLGAITPSTALKIISACLGDCCPSFQHVGAERKASCRALGGPAAWLAMVVLVNVGRWRLKSYQPTVGIVKIVFGSIFFLPT
jgi:hypothetical protein